MDAIPVTVITGFLGAGKTTLLDQWLRACTPGEAAVIVNEVGAVGIDGELLRARASALIEITGGCICCTTYQELVSALRTLATTQPKRIFVETSGAASPAGVVRAVHGSEQVFLDGIVTVVNAAAQRGNDVPFADLAAEQLGYADVVVLSNADQLDLHSLEEIQNATSSANPTAVIARADNGVLREYNSFHLLLASRKEYLLHSIPAASAHRGIETLVLTAQGELDEDRFGDWMETGLGRFEARLLRVKGIVAIAGVDERIILQGVASRMQASPGESWNNDQRTSRIVIIGFGLDQADLTEGFKNCLTALA